MEAWDHREWLDGLLLSPTSDASLISFAGQGGLLISPCLTPVHLEKLGIDPGVAIAGLEPQHAAYLECHRETLFRRGTTT